MTRRQTASIVFVVLCVVLVAAAVTLNIGWILVNGRRVAPLVLGVITFALIIAGLIVYTVFLVREMGITEQQDSFLNSVTHELKTPIASIRLYLETLQARDVGEAQRKEFYRIMLQDADRLQQTVEQVLQGRRPHAAPQARTARAGRSRDAGAGVRRGGATRHHLAPEVLQLTADERRRSSLLVEGNVDDLRTAIANLLDNAVKYSLKAIHVTVELPTPTPDRACVRVRDEGVGIPRNQLKRIFNRFYRFQAHGFKVKGTGLGLYIVGSIAQAARRTRVRRERRRGQGRDVHAGTAAPGAHLTRTRTGFVIMSRILIVEDEAHLADGLRFNLEAEGHEVDVLGDGNRRWRICSTESLALRRHRARRDAARQGRLRGGEAKCARRASTCRS